MLDNLKRSDNIYYSQSWAFWVVYHYLPLFFLFIYGESPSPSFGTSTLSGCQCLKSDCHCMLWITLFCFNICLIYCMLVSLKWSLYGGIAAPFLKSSENSPLVSLLFKSASSAFSPPCFFLYILGIYGKKLLSVTTGLNNLVLG